MTRLFLIFVLATAISVFASISLSAKDDAFWLSDDLDTTTYYYTKINDTSYYFKFEKISQEKVEGHFFVSDGSVSVVQEKFSITRKARNYIINFREGAVKTRIECFVRENGLVVKYAVVKKFLGIFNKLSWSEEINFKKYRTPDFVRYPQRYKTKVFKKAQVLYDVVYGNAEGYWDSYASETESYFEILSNGILSSVTKKDLKLKMDIYYPEGDSLDKRPLIMFIHGGGFYIGDKRSEAMVEWCKYFAEMGYVTASVNYRLGYKPIGPSVERAGYRALQDIHAAMRFLVKNADYYGIDPNLLFAGGSSAGGVTSLNLAFMRNNNRPESTKVGILHEDLGNIESSTNNIKQKFQLQAIANMWGAVTDLDILKNSKTSVISFHGDADKVVPIDYDYPFQDMKSGFSNLVLEKMYGSLPIHIKLKELGVREELHIFESAGHSPHVDVDNNLNKTFKFISEEIRDFFYEEIFPADCKIQSIPATPFERAMPVYKTDCANYSKIFWEVEGGIITGTKDNQVRVIWFENAKTHKLKLSILSETSAGFYDEYEF
jgi:acetyl esterase/lipase